MLFTTGSSIFFVELEEGDRTKRFLLPKTENITDKLNALMEQYPDVKLTRSGTAEITSKLDEIPEPMKTGFTSIPSVVTEVYNLKLIDHPVLTEGQARYSPVLVKELMEVVVKKKEDLVDPIPESSSVAPIKADLTSQLKQQLAKQIEEKAQEKKPEPSSKSEPESSSEEKELPSIKLEDFLSKEKEKKEKSYTSRAIVQTRKTQPISKIDLILAKIERIEISLGLDEEMEIAEDAAQQLQDWFNSHVEKVGWDETFEILARKIRI